MSLWQRRVGALALLLLSKLGSGGAESVTAMCGCTHTPVAVLVCIWGFGVCSSSDMWVRSPPIAVHVCIWGCWVWQRRVGTLALPSLANIQSKAIVISGLFF